MRCILTGTFEQSGNYESVVGRVPPESELDYLYEYNRPLYFAIMREINRIYDSIALLEDLYKDYYDNYLSYN